MSDFVSAVQTAIESSLSDVSTIMPGTLVSFDASRNRAVVRPTLPKALADGRDLEAPMIHECPVAWPQGGGFLMTWPLRPGDRVELRFAQRSLEGWLDGRDAAPDDPRRFDLADCIVDPCLKATGVVADPDAVQMAYDGTVVRFEPGGINRIRSTKTFIENDTEIRGDVLIVGDTTMQGNQQVNGVVGVSQTVTAQGNVTAGTVSLQGHVHTASGGTGIGGPPVT